jgi:hypothetical protein
MKNGSFVINISQYSALNLYNVLINGGMTKYSAALMQDEIVQNVFENGRNFHFQCHLCCGLREETYFSYPFYFDKNMNLLCDACYRHGKIFVYPWPYKANSKTPFEMLNDLVAHRRKKNESNDEFKENIEKKRKVKEVTVKEVAVKEVTVKEVTVKEVTVKEVAVKEVTVKEVTTEEKMVISLETEKQVEKEVEKELGVAMKELVINEKINPGNEKIDRKKSTSKVEYIRKQKTVKVYPSKVQVNVDTRMAALVKLRKEIGGPFVVYFPGDIGNQWNIGVVIPSNEIDNKMPRPKSIEQVLIRFIDCCHD